MANIENIKIGDSNPDALMTDRPYQETANQFVSFGSIVPKDNVWDDMPVNEWEINDGWDVEFINNGRKLKINKFKIDTWGLRQKHPKDTIDSIGFTTDLKVRVEGLAYVHQNIIQANVGSDEITGFVQAKFNSIGWNTVWYPGLYKDDTSGYYLQGLVIQGCGCYTQSWEQYGDASYTMGRAPWEVNGNRDHFVTDGIRPSGAMTGVANGVCIGLFGGCQTATAHLDTTNGAYRIYDISNHPIYIDLDVPDDSQRIDVTSVECWDAYLGNEHIYHKDKTVENCLRKYGLIKTEEKDSSEGVHIVQNQFINNTGISAPSGLILPVVTDINDLLATSGWSFNCNADRNFIEYIRDWLTTHDCPIYQCDYNKIKGVFQGSNMDGDIIVNINIEGDTGLDRFIEGSSINKITFNLGENMAITSCNTLFKSSPITEIVTNKPLQSRDVSGMFEYCSKIVTIPEGLIDFKHNVNYTVKLHNTDFVLSSNSLQWMFDGCNSLETVNAYDNDAESEIIENVIDVISLYYAFSGCSNLKTIKYILDMSLYRTDYQDYNNYQNAWSQVHQLQSVRFRGINRTFYAGNVWLEGNEYHWWPLDAESITYLFDKAADLVNSYRPKYYIADYSDIIIRDEYGLIYTESGITAEELGDIQIYYGISSLTDDGYKDTCDFYYQYNGNYYSIRTLASLYDDLISTHSYLADFLDSSTANLIKNKAMFGASDRCGETLNGYMRFIPDTAFVSTPDNNQYDIYIGSVANQNVTDEMVTAMNAKGWNIYVDNVLRIV